MNATELCFTPATTLIQLIRTKQLSPVEVVEAVLARIATVDRHVNAYTTVAADQARAAARLAEQQVMRSEPLGLLHGAPISFKDLTPTAGIRTTFGSKIFEHNVPTEDALIVTRAKAAGAIVIGKTNTPEFGCKGATDNRIFGVTRNPWRLDCISGGSSGGAGAALAAGLAPLAEGSDLAGSIRIPAAICGVVGLKPSPGRIPRYPAAQGWNAMSLNGPMSRTVRDAALLFNAWVGPDERDPISLPNTREDFLAACEQPLGRWKIAWSTDLGYGPVEPEVAEIAGAAARAFVDLGCDVEPGYPEFNDPESLFISLTAPMRAAGMQPHLAKWADQMDPILVSRVGQADKLSAVDYERAFIQRSAMYQVARSFFERFDLLLTPTVAAAAPLIEAPFPPTQVAGQAITSSIGWFPCTYPWNITGHPAITVPAGWTAAGLPVGLQIIGPRYAEARLFQAAAAFEAARPWAQRRPNLPDSG